MAFRLKNDEFFTGLIRQPGGDAERIVVERGTRGATVAQTVIAAGSAGWDWVIELRRDAGEIDQPSEVIQHWSSLAGDLPPVVRPAGL